MNALVSARSTIAEVQKVISEQLEIAISDLDPARPLEELGVDSLSIIEVMFTLEETFGVRMGDDRVPIRTVQDIADIVDRLVSERDRAAS